MSMYEVDSPTRATLAPLCAPDTRDTLLDRLCEVAHAVPDAVALVTDDGSVTFDTLLHRTYAVARKIAHLAPGAPRAVAVDAACSTASITSMLAVMAAGHALVPLDAHLPVGRKQQIVDASSALYLTDEDLAAADDSAFPLPTVTGARTALVAYTSGSTGTAKGVVLSHRMCLSKAYEVSSALALSPCDRVGNALPISFGAGMNTLFAGLLSGATVYCRDPRSGQASALPEWMKRSALTTLHCSPSLVRSLRNHSTPPVHAVPENVIPSLRVVTTYGEALHSQDVLAFRAALGTGATFVNWYATTEAGAVAYGKYRADRVLPAGFLTADSYPKSKRIEIVGADRLPVAPGAVGEIHVVAPCLADGYLGQDDLTRSRFTDHGSYRRYATGDLGKLDNSGVLRLVGRADDAVKVRGYLVEPTEVEEAVRAVAGVRDLAVVGRTVDGLTELELFVVTEGVSVETVRDSLAAALPPWMSPRFITQTESIPRTERGKVDRAKLPLRRSSSASHADEADSTSIRRAAGATQSWVANIIEKHLGTANAGIDVHLTELGATSLALTGITVDVQRAFHICLTLEELIGAMTIARLASLVDAKLAESESSRAEAEESSIMVPLRSQGTLAPVFIVAGGGVPAAGLAALARHLDGQRPVYALQAKGLAQRAVPNRTVRSAARTYVRELRRVQPEGPYHLAGHSLGGWIALEMADILRRAGHDVARVVLLDPRLYRRLMDRLPSGKDLEAAPLPVPTPAATAVVSRPSLRTRIEVVGRIVTAGILQPSVTERWLAFARVGTLALLLHRPKPWNGPVSVIVTDDNTASRASWAALATGELSIDRVDGSHIDMVREPVVSEVARVMDRVLSTPADRTDRT